VLYCTFTQFANQSSMRNFVESFFEVHIYAVNLSTQIQTQSPFIYYI